MSNTGPEKNRSDSMRKLTSSIDVLKHMMENRIKQLSDNKPLDDLLFYYYELMQYLLEKKKLEPTDLSALEKQLKNQPIAGLFDFYKTIIATTTLTKLEKETISDGTSKDVKNYGHVNYEAYKARKLLEMFEKKVAYEAPAQNKYRKENQVEKYDFGSLIDVERRVKTIHSYSTFLERNSRLTENWMEKEGPILSTKLSKEKTLIKELKTLKENLPQQEQKIKDSIIKIIKKLWLL